MKVLSIFLFLAVVLGFAGCDSGSNSDFPIGRPTDFPIGYFHQENFNAALEEWTGQGVSDYSFDVVGYDCEPNIPFVTETAMYSGYISSDAKFCAHVTVAGGGIVSIENIDPGEMTWGPPNWELSFNPDEEIGAYTWGAIPDVFDKIRSISMEEEPSPYVYDWSFSYAIGNGFPGERFSFHVNIFSFEPRFHGDYPLFLRAILLYIVNFKVTENAP